MALPDPIAELRGQLVRAVLAYAKPAGYRAARRLGIDSPRMCDLLHGRVEGFSVQRLIRMLARVNHRVTVTITVVPMPPDGIYAAGQPPRQKRRRRLRAETG